MKEFVLQGEKNTSKIFIGNGIVKEASDYVSSMIQSNKKPSKICVITDSNVAKLYLESVRNMLSELELPIFVHIIPAGEEFKTLDTVAEIYDTLGENQFGRNDMLIALGGGVTGDVAGFVAATYVRGIRYLVQIPTTLLAQVDSSVGGKTGVDLVHGKNLVGAFRQPDLVLIDPELLHTLTDHIFRSGLAEVIKYGCIWDPEILTMIGEDDYKEHMEDWIQRCVAIKVHVVQEDELEEGLRKILNFGHTVGHGVERLGNYVDLSHGEAVAIGMVAATKLGEQRSITKIGTAKELVEILKKVGLPVQIQYPMESVHQALLTDKKKQGNQIDFVFIEAFGTTKIEGLSVEELQKTMKRLED